MKQRRNKNNEKRQHEIGERYKIEFVGKHKCNTRGYVEGSSTFQPSLGEFINLSVIKIFLE